MNKIKDVLHFPQSNEAARGEVDHNTPGSFPTEDEPAPSGLHQDPTATTSHEYDHNKLHKPNDPRGWTDDGKTASGHRYTDSGVGLTDSNDAAQGNRPTAEQRLDKHQFDKTEPITQVDQKAVSGQRLEPSFAGAPVAAGLESQPTTTETLGTDTSSAVNNPEGGQISERSDGSPGAIMGGTPYWGDLPQRGVHNTITGHGSLEDDSRNHRALHSDRSDVDTTQNASSIAYTNPSGSSQQRSFPIVSGTRGASTNTREVEGSEDSRFEQGTAATATAFGVAGVGAAHEAGKNDEKYDEHSDTKEVNNTKHRESEKDSKLFGLLHRDSKSKEKSKNESEDVKTKSSTHDKESKIAGVFHRSSDGKQESDAITDHATTREEPQNHDPKSTLGFAAIGAGGATAAYYASQGHDNSTKSQDLDTVRQPQQPPVRSIDGEGSAMYSGGALDSLDRNDSAFQSNTTAMPSSTYDGMGESRQQGSGVVTLADTLVFPEAKKSDMERTQGSVSASSPKGPAMAAATVPLAAATENMQPNESSTSREATTSAARAANNGQYRTLASGTPSGIKLGSDVGN